MSRQRRIHKPLKQKFDEVLEKIAEGNGTKKQNKKNEKKPCEKAS